MPFESQRTLRCPSDWTGLWQDTPSSFWIEVLWLDNYLSEQYPHAVVVVSHDADFLDNICALWGWQQVNVVWYMFHHCSVWTKRFADFTIVAKSSGGLPFLFCALPNQLGAPGAALLKHCFSVLLMRAHTHTHTHTHTHIHVHTNTPAAVRCRIPHNLRCTFFDDPDSSQLYYYLTNPYHHGECGYHGHVILILFFCTVLAWNGDKRPQLHVRRQDVV